MSRIGIMGGTFNPIHIGHLMLAEQALESAHLDQIWMIPTGCSYLKTKEGITILPGTERYDMVQRAIADNDRFRSLDIEIKRPGDSYSCSTGRCGYEGNAGENQAVGGTFFCEDTVALFSKN